VPVHNDRLLFEMLNLEGAQAGLSWLTILKKRDGYRRAFDNFDVTKVVRYGEAKRARAEKRFPARRSRWRELIGGAPDAEA